MSKIDALTLAVLILGLLGLVVQNVARNAPAAQGRRMTAELGDTTFDEVAYDGDADVLYLRVSGAEAVEFDESPEGHALAFDADGRLCGITIIGGKHPAPPRGEGLMPTSSVLAQLLMGKRKTEIVADLVDERDEARAEVERLREAIQTFIDRYETESWTEVVEVSRWVNELHAALHPSEEKEPPFTATNTPDRLVAKFPPSEEKDDERCPACGADRGGGVLASRSIPGTNIPASCEHPFHQHPSEEKGTPNGGEHCAPPGGPNNVCFRYPDGSCSSCGFPPEEARAEVERLREALERIAAWKQHDDSYPEPTFHQVRGIARAALHPSEEKD